MGRKRGEEEKRNERGKSALAEMSGHHPTYTMGGTLMAGGLVGFIRRSSLPSLLAGGALGGGFLLAGQAIEHAQAPEVGCCSPAGAVALLIAQR